MGNSKSSEKVEKLRKEASLTFNLVKAYIEATDEETIGKIQSCCSEIMSKKAKKIPENVLLLGLEPFQITKAKVESKDLPFSTWVLAWRTWKLTWTSSGEDMIIHFATHENTIYAGTTLAQAHLMAVGPLKLEVGFPDGYFHNRIEGLEDFCKLLISKGCKSKNDADDFFQYILSLDELSIYRVKNPFENPDIDFNECL